MCRCGDAGRSAARSVGFWMAVAIGAFQVLEAARAPLDPVGFADYVGLPLAQTADTGFVLVYALRTGFIGTIVLVFCTRRQLEPLMWMALVAVLLPLGDALLANAAGAPATTIAGHAAIATFLVVTFFLLRRVLARRPEAAR